MLEIDQEEALGAAGMGAWSWDITADWFCWTPDAARLFGIDGTWIESQHAFLLRVHPADRVRVSGLIASALDGAERAVLEFRSRRSDGSLRWLRCIGRVSIDGRGRAVRMSGVIDDFTGQRTVEARPAAPPQPPDTFTSSEVAQVLGVAEATVKRLADSGSIACLRSSPRGKRFFSSRQLVDYLRGPRRVPMRDLGEALRSLDLKEAVAQVIEELARGRKLEDVLDEAILPAGSGAPSGFTADLLKRLAALVGPGRLKGRPALLARVGDAVLEARVIECVLRAAGFEVLSASDSVNAAELEGMARRVGAEFAIFVMGRQQTELHAAALTAASALAQHLVQGRVCVQSSDDLAVPSGVARIRTMSELGKLLRSA